MISLQAFKAIVAQLPTLSDKMGVTREDRENVYFRTRGEFEDDISAPSAQKYEIVVTVGEVHWCQYRAIFSMCGTRLLSLARVSWYSDSGIHYSPVSL